MAQELTFGIRMAFDGKEVTGGMTVTREQIRALAQDAKGAGESADSLATAIRRIGHYGSSLTFGYSFLQVAQAAAQAADTFSLVESRLRLVSGSAQAASIAQDELFKIAQETRQSFPELASTYAQVARSAAELGVSQERLIAMSRTLSQAVAISGGTAESAKAALVQLSQGMASGTLRGEELNSVMEQTPRLAQAIAEGLGVSIGSLRKMGEQGELTAEKVIGALEKAAPAVADEFRRMTPTIGNAFTQLGNSAGNLIDKINDATKASRGLYNMLSGISGLLDKTASGLERGMTAGRAGANARAMASVEAQLKGLHERDPRRKGLEDQLRRLRNESLEGMAEMPVLGKPMNNGASADYLALSQKLSGVSQDFQKSLSVLHKEYERGGISLDEYRAKVKKLIETETELGKKSVKKASTEKTPLERMLALGQKNELDAYYETGGEETLREVAHKRELEEAKRQTQERAKGEALLADYERANALMVERIAREAELATMTERQRVVAEALYKVEDEGARIRDRILRDLPAGVAQTQALADAEAELAAQKERVAAATEKSYDAQRTFEAGWQRTFRRYEEEATNAARQAETVFSSATDAMADAATRLAMRQKVSFNDIGNAFVAMLIRMQMQAAAARITAGAGEWLSKIFGSGSPGSFVASGHADLGSGLTLESAPVVNALGWHEGGDIAWGMPTFTRPVPASLFDHAPRYHTGLARGEIAAILKDDETVLTARQSRRVADRLSAAQAAPSGVVVNVIESPGKGGQTRQRQEGGQTIVDVMVEQVKGAIAADIVRGSGPVPAALGQTYGLNRVAGAY